MLEKIFIQSLDELKDIVKKSDGLKLNSLEDELELWDEHGVPEGKTKSEKIRNHKIYIALNEVPDYAIDSTFIIDGPEFRILFLIDASDELLKEINEYIQEMY